MATFIVNSAILSPSGTGNAKACATGTPKMLINQGIKDVKVKRCYCCSDEGRAVFVVEGSDKDAVLEAFRKVSVPVASILEAEEVKAEM